MSDYPAAGPAAGSGDVPDTATVSADGGRPGRHAGDRKWPLWARLLVAVGLLPVAAAVILAAENAFTSAIGQFFGPLMVTFMVVIVIVVWLATGRGQR